MRDLQRPLWMYAKGAMFLLMGGLTFVLLLLPQNLAPRMILQCLMIWAFARAYYFAFYVIEHYIDPQYRFAGLWDFLGYLRRSRLPLHKD